MTTLDKEAALAHLERARAELLGPEGGCLMCALARGASRPAPLVETDAAVVVLDRFARRRGHLLVIARAHVERVDEIPWALWLAVERLVFEARQALDRALAPTQIYSATLGSVTPLPMSFRHYHTHVIPVPESDERARPARVLSWSEGVTIYEEAEAEALRAELLSAWPKR